MNQLVQLIEYGLVKAYDYVIYRPLTLGSMPLIKTLPRLYA